MNKDYPEKESYFQLIDKEISTDTNYDEINYYCDYADDKIFGLNKTRNTLLYN